MGELFDEGRLAAGCLESMTTSDKISLLSGTDFWHTVSIPKHNILKLRMSDGPNGVRGTKFFAGVPAACLPCGTGLGATWDVQMLSKAGALLARECHAKSVHVWLGPTVNIQRSPLGGRGFESFSEDPLLSGTLASSMISTLQNSGVASAIKHFVANDMEHQRTLVNCIMSQRALREIYLLPFQIAVRDSNPWVIMTSYNRVNGTHMCEHKPILTDIVRKEWNYDGCLLSDWYGTYSTVEAIDAGLDMEMPGPTVWRGDRVLTALGVGKLSASTIDERAGAVLRLVERCVSSSSCPIPEMGPETELDSSEDRDILTKMASDSLVLLKNDDKVLPLEATKSIAIIGPNARKSYLSGGGSASLRPYRAVSIYEGLTTCIGREIPHAQGCQTYNRLPVLGDLVKSPETGRLGWFSMKMYKLLPFVDIGSSSKSARCQQPLDLYELDDSDIILYDYSNSAAPDNVVYAVIEADLVIDETGDYDFGLTVAGTARLYVDERIIVDNWDQQTRGESFFGSGSTEKVGRIHLEAGREYRLRVDFGSAPTSNLNKAGAPVFGAGGVRIGCARVRDQDTELELAVELAASVDQVVVCVGLGPEWESEGSDRTEYDLPGRQGELISRINQVNKSVVVVIQSGTPVAGPWDETRAVLQAWYGGNESGHGIAHVLLGKTSPAGKLPLSWPRRVEDSPAYLSYRSEAGRCYYSEDIYVGYRFYEKVKRPVQWPFGYGLSYASFAIRDTGLDIRGVGLGAQLHISAAVYNESQAVDAAEVCQVYVERVSASDFGRPIKELKGYQKVFVAHQQRRQVIIRISCKYATSVWDETADAWLMEKGVYRVHVGNSSDCTQPCGEFAVEETTHWRGL